MKRLSRRDARRLLAVHHFTPGTIKSIFSRLGSVQYDPLNPVGQNHDLVLQCRVPGYSVGEWRDLAYRERFLYDFWDKQASLVLMDDYPKRRIYFQWHASRQHCRVLEHYPDAVYLVLKELQDRGPLASAEFHFQQHRQEWEGSWYGPKLTKNVLRALWHTGRVQTHKRIGDKHVYDFAEKIIPAHLFQAEELPEEECIDWLLVHRHKAIGLLRPNAGAEVWSMAITAQQRYHHVQKLVSRGELVPLEIEGVRYHAVPEIFDQLDNSVEKNDQLRFIAPLDQLMWDRKGVAQLFDFEYVWEVYKPAVQRRWGYYVLPVMWGDRFVARMDSRLSSGVWQIKSWHWEEEVELCAPLLDALESAICRFRKYLQAHSLTLSQQVDRKTGDAIRQGFIQDSVT